MGRWPALESGCFSHFLVSCCKQTKCLDNGFVESQYLDQFDTQVACERAHSR